MKRTIFELEAERMQWALFTFPEATASSSLIKLSGEIEEVEKLLDLPFDARDYPTARFTDELKEEYADCLMCLFDSAGRAGITPEMIVQAFEQKLEKNKARKWIKNNDNTYSHVK